MTYPISDVTRRVVYSGSAGVGPYNFTFEILTQTDIAVYKNSTLLTLTTDYTVTINTNGTGSITLVSAATGADRITIVGDRGIQRTTDFVTGGDLFANTLNQELDALTIYAQQIDEKAERGLKAPVTDPTDINMTLPVKASRLGKVLSFDSTTGDPIASITASEVANAQTYATNAANSATAAAASATSAGAEAVAASNFASSASTSATNASNSASSASSSASSASSSASSASTSASNAATSATNAANSASSASTSASNASTSATNAANSASAAATSATNASNAQAAAETARDQTLAAYDSFDDRYLGTKTSDPTVDNDGNPLVAGALYFNSVDGIMKLYTGSAWVAAYVQGVASSVGFTPSGNIIATNVQTAIEELDTEKIATTAIGSTVQAYDADTAKTDVAQSFTAAQRGSISALTDGATITPNFALANNFSVTLGGNRTLANPTNLTAGQHGVIVITQDSTGSRTLAYGSNWKFPNGTAPTLTTTASAVDVLAYYVESTTRITARLIGDVK